MNGVLINNRLKFITKYLTNETIEIAINDKNELWIEEPQGWRKIEDENINKENIMNLAETLATLTHQVYNDNYPFLSVSIPLNFKNLTGRFQFISPSKTSSSIGAVTVRILKSRKIALDEYIYDSKSSNINGTSPQEYIEKAIKEGETTLIAGGTQSGKTTLLNSLLDMIPLNQRIITIEDVQEIVLNKHPNIVRILKSKASSDISQTNYDDIINVVLRKRPDRIILGEIDIGNTVPFLRISNTGHKGGISTIHANSATKAIEAMITNATMAGYANSPKLLDYVKEAIDLIIYIQKIKGEEKRSIAIFKTKRLNLCK